MSHNVPLLRSGGLPNEGINHGLEMRGDLRGLDSLGQLPLVGMFKCVLSVSRRAVERKDATQVQNIGSSTFTNVHDLWNSSAWSTYARAETVSGSRKFARRRMHVQTSTFGAACIPVLRNFEK